MIAASCDNEFMSLPLKQQLELIEKEIEQLKQFAEKLKTSDYPAMLKINRD